MSLAPWTSENHRSSTSHAATHAAAMQVAEMLLMSTVYSEQRLKALVSRSSMSRCHVQFLLAQPRPLEMTWNWATWRANSWTSPSTCGCRLKNGLTFFHDFAQPQWIFTFLPYQLELFGGFLSHQWYPQFSSIFWIMGNQGSSGDPPGPHAVGLQRRALRSTGLPLPVAIWGGGRPAEFWVPDSEPRSWSIFMI